MSEVYKMLNGVYDKRVTGGMLIANKRINKPGPAQVGAISKAQK